MAGLYSNENFPLPVVERLRALGHDVLTLQEAGKADQALRSALRVVENALEACAHGGGQAAPCRCLPGKPSARGCLAKSG